MAYESKWVQLGKSLLAGGKLEEITLKGKKYTFNPKQVEFISDFKNRYCLNAGGYGSGKSLALYIKLILFVMCFPGNRVLLGRKTLSDVERAILPDLFELLRSDWYEYRVKDGVLNFKNGSQIILFGLDAMQSGGAADIKKAEQKVKSLNLGAFFIDQLEEVEYPVFEALTARLRRMTVPGHEDIPIQQGNATTNPANYWAYEYFVANPRPNYVLYESSMYDNAENLPAEYIKDQEAKGEDYLRRYVMGEWNTDLMLKGSVFAKEHIRYQEQFRKLPVFEEECEIYEPYVAGNEYRMGVDPSEGIVDPSSISVIDQGGKKVAKFNGKLPTNGLADKVKFLYFKYHKPLIVPEANAAGAALIREIRDLKVYRRKQMDYKYDKETEKLGFKMSWDTKSQLIHHFQELLRKRKIKIFDKKTIEELKVFLWSDSASFYGAGAAKGFHDDDVISTMLAFWEYHPTKMMEIQAAKATPAVRKRVFQYN